MPPAKKRKIVDESKVQDGTALQDTATGESQDPPHLDQESDIERTGDSQPDTTSEDRDRERRERFRALKARAVSTLPSHNFRVAET